MKLRTLQLMFGWVSLNKQMLTADYLASVDVECRRRILQRPEDRFLTVHGPHDRRRFSTISGVACRGLCSLTGCLVSGTAQGVSGRLASVCQSPTHAVALFGIMFRRQDERRRDASRRITA